MTARGATHASRLLLALSLGGAACHMYHPAEIPGARVAVQDTAGAHDLTPYDLTGSSTAWAETFGADSLFRPRVTWLAGNTIGITLAHPGHVAVLFVSRCGAYAAVPGHDLTTRAPAGEQRYLLVPPFRGGCQANFWRPVITVIAATLPLHGEVLEEKARSAHTIEELMSGRSDAWAAYAIFNTR